MFAEIYENIKKMENADKKPMLKSEAQSALKVANEEYTTCLSKDFLTKFLNGENVRVENFCVGQKAKMDELDQLVYGK